MEPKVSIIMPVYNGEPHLCKSLDSALGQSLKDIELLCIDDGSTDGSPRILAQYEAADERVRVFRQNNMGAGKARNVGLQEASGEFVAFLDSDDYYPSADCLQKLHELAKSTGTHVAGGSLLFLKDGKEEPARLGQTSFTFASEEVLNYADFQQAYYYQRFIYSRALLSDAQLRFPNYRRFQDVVFFVKAMVAAGEFAATPLSVYVYKVSGGFANLSDAQINDMLLGYIDVLTIARDNDFKELASFLSKRICEPSPIQNMVLESIQAGNHTAEMRYGTVCSLAGDMLVNKSQGEVSRPRQLLEKLKAAFSRSAR